MMWAAALAGGAKQLMIVTTAIIGLFVGLAIGMTGVGGGVLTVPLLTLTLGLQPSDCVGTALLVSAIVKVYATLRYFLRHQVDGKAFVRLALGGVPGVLVGSIMLNAYFGEHSNRSVLVILGVIVSLSAGASLFRSGHRSQNPMARPRALSVLACFIGMEVGFSSAGAGALGSILLFNMTALPAATVVGTDLAFGLLLSLVGGLMHVAVGSWRPDLLLPLAAGGLLGVLCGTSLAARVPGKRIRQVALAFAMLLGLALIAKGL
jgi:uncharacterized membrane protein YfcA